MIILASAASELAMEDHPGDWDRVRLEEDEGRPVDAKGAIGEARVVIVRDGMLRLCCLCSSEIVMRQRGDGDMWFGTGDHKTR